MNGKRCALALAMLAAALLLMGCGAAEPTPVGPVDLYTRRTLVQYDRTQAGQGQGSTLQAESLDLNYAVTVDDSGQARLAFEDFLVVDIFRDSDLRIEGLSASDAPPAYRLRLEGGTISGTTDAQSLAEERVEPEVRIDTKWAVIRKKGTVFIIHFDKASEQTWVVVKRGAMSVTAAGKEVLVEGGQQTWVEPGKAPIDPIPACRNLVGSRFPLIDALTNDVLPDLEWLCNDSTLTGSTPTIAAPSPTPTPTLRPLPQPTATPRPPTPTPLPTGTPYASIFANPGVIQACTCTNLGWDAGNVTSVTLDGATVGLKGNRQECPADSRYYNLQAIDPNGRSIDASTNVQVLKPFINFGSDSSTVTYYIDPCANLYWDTENVLSVSLGGENVSQHGNRDVCPTSTTTYKLHVTTTCGAEDRSVTIEAIGFDSDGSAISQTLSSPLSAMTSVTRGYGE